MPNRTIPLSGNAAFALCSVSCGINLSQTFGFFAGTPVCWLMTCSLLLLCEGKMTVLKGPQDATVSLRRTWPSFSRWNTSLFFIICLLTSCQTDLRLNAYLFLSAFLLKNNTNPLISIQFDCLSDKKAISSHVQVCLLHRTRSRNSREISRCVLFWFHVVRCFGENQTDSWFMIINKQTVYHFTHHKKYLTAWKRTVA